MRYGRSDGIIWVRLFFPFLFLECLICAFFGVLRVWVFLSLVPQWWFGDVALVRQRHLGFSFLFYALSEVPYELFLSTSGSGLLFLVLEV